MRKQRGGGGMSEVYSPKDQINGDDLSSRVPSVPRYPSLQHSAGETYRKYISTSIGSTPSGNS